MKHYEKLIELGCFSRNDVCNLTNNYNTAGTLLKSYLKKGYVKQVKRNLYVAINLADRQPVVSKFRIAGRITPSAYVSHHAAFEYYGCANQVSYHVEVSSETPFSSFGFDGLYYRHVTSRIQDGIVIRPDRVRITDMERTVLDGIHDFEKVAGLEELLRCIELIPSIREDKLLSYLASYDKQVLYQKTGFILRHYQNIFNLSEAFFSECLAHIGKSTRYLTMKGAVSYNSEWRLVVPEDLHRITNKGVNYDADI